MKKTKLGNDVIRWMKKSIQLANNSIDKDLCVGAILVSKNKELIVSHYSGEKNKKWVDGLILKVIEKNIKEPMDLFLTINTIDEQKKFEINKLLLNFLVENIYVGLPDPRLTQYYPNDIILKLNNVFRYPDFLQLQILEQNKIKYEESKQCIRSNYYFYSKKISSLTLEKLKRNGFDITLKDILENKDVDKLSDYLSKKFNIKITHALSLVNNALSYAFNEKYSNYDYSKDARLLDSKWIDSFYYVYKKQTHKLFSNNNIINVGVGNGSESLSLFKNCNKITFVDVAKDGLEKIKKAMPHAEIICSRAESLDNIDNENYSLYVSLRTFNSSFFNYQKAIKEVYRVLMNNGVLIISIANGFLDLSKNYVMPGLILPNSEFVDIYRGFNLVKAIQMN